MKLIRCLTAILLCSMLSLAQGNGHHSAGGSTKSPDRLPAAKGSGAAETVISSASRDTQNQQKQLSQLERGSGQVKHTPVAHSQRAALPKEHSAHNPPINFSHQAPKSGMAHSPSSHSTSSGTSHRARY